ncbi:hypothetical protein BH09ACT8_BH09ACT8_45830 [soil metagenome]
MKESSQDTWVLSNGQVYALTSDARSHTLLPDGRDLDTHFFEWTDFNDAVSKCVGDIEREPRIKAAEFNPFTARCGRSLSPVRS